MLWWKHFESFSTAAARGLSGAGVEIAAEAEAVVAAAVGAALMNPQRLEWLP